MFLRVIIFNENLKIKKKTYIILNKEAFMGRNFQRKGETLMEIKRDSYLEQLISYRFDGLVKVITGIRRCGKSYLLKNI